MVLEIKEKHDCDCEYCDKQGDTEYEVYRCEICHTEYEGYLGEKEALDCEKRHKESDDLLYGQYMFNKSREILDKSANHIGQKRLI